MSTSMQARREILKSLLSYYYDCITTPSPYSNYADELEIRFGGSNKFRRFTKIDYDNVVEHLYACGFSPNTTDGGHGKEGMQSLRIYTEYQFEGRTQLSKVRAEIDGIDAIRDYCANNDVQTLIDKRPAPIRFVRKTPPYPPNVDKQNRVENTVFYEDEYNAKIVHQKEETVNHRRNENIQKTIQNWKSLGKMFRHMNRTRFAHPSIPIFVDISIVKTNKMIVVKRGEGNIAKRSFRPTDIQSAGIFDPDIIPNYEIEIELNNDMIKQYFLKSSQRIGKEKGVEYLTDLVRRGLQLIVGGLQQSFYPITYLEARDVIRSYTHQIHNAGSSGVVANQETSSMDDFKPNPRLFIGPNSITLQLENVVPTPGVANIQEKFCVTDKADGQRSLLYIHKNCKVYLIDMNMNVKFTGLVVPDTKWSGIMLDGEHIRKIDKESMVKQDIYAAFDVYFYRAQDDEGNIVDTRPFPFINVDALTLKTTKGQKSVNVDENIKRAPYRYPILQTICQSLQNTAISSAPANGGAGCYFTFKCKKFEVPLASSSESIFTMCKRILDTKYEYETDGLIFTPCHLGVGMYDVPREHSAEDAAGTVARPPNQRSTWELSFKWKPPLQNTIDFWVRVDKDKKTGKETIYNKMMGDSIVPYKTLILCCTFDTTQDEIADPFHTLIMDTVKPENFMNNGEGKVKGMPFLPTQPYDRMAPFCYQSLMSDNAGRKYMLTEEGQIFHDNTIVEFQYIPENPPGWRWKPLRVRYDKTAQMLSMGNYFGNSFRVANANWHSIHNPVSQDIISGVVPLTEVKQQDYEEEADDNTTEMIDEVQTDIGKVYYKRKSVRTLGEVSHTVELRKFHNYVKSQIIQYAAQKSGTNPLLIDYAVGKAGDLHKWKTSNIQFVFGIDVSKDNIDNTRDGACARYLREYYKSWDSTRPKCIFLQGNSGLSIRNGNAFDNVEHRDIASAIFSSAAAKPGLGHAVAKVAGIGKDGFHISSCQFAIHYFFSDESTLHSFLRNVSDCTRIGGLFIGTCLDGETVFNLLNKSKSGQIGFTHTDQAGEPHTLLEIQRKYTHEGFPPNAGSLGYAIRVFQESIGQYITEYLVNYKYLRDIMAKYGFELAEEFQGVKGNGSKTFETLYKSYLKTRDAAEMSEAEKSISYMNRYFVFQKKRDPDENYLKSLGIQTPSPIILAADDAEIPVEDELPPPVLEESEEEEPVSEEESDEEEEKKKESKKEEVLEQPEKTVAKTVSNKKTSKKITIAKPAAVVVAPAAKTRKLKHKIKLAEDYYSPLSEPTP
jgi:hypothetical protein